MGDALLFARKPGLQATHPKSPESKLLPVFTESAFSQANAQLEGNVEISIPSRSLKSAAMGETHSIMFWLDWEEKV